MTLVEKHSGCAKPASRGAGPTSLSAESNSSASEAARLTEEDPTTIIGTLNQNDLRRAEVVFLLQAGSITAEEARHLLGLGKSQIYKIWARFRAGGLAAILPKRRNVTSNRAYPLSLKDRVIEIIREEYYDFGPTLISEMLEISHGIKLSVETIRQWMIKARVWVENRAERRRLHQPRNRKKAYGELVQIDGSDHAWFEARGPRCTVMVLVDDATGRLQGLEFVRRECRAAYESVTYKYILNHGRPLRMQTDKHSSIWSREKASLFNNSLKRLNIVHSVANSAQSKGRVERMNRTLQDRLVKELRLKGISSIEEANAFAPNFMERFNARFARQPILAHNFHRPNPGMEELDAAFSRWYTRRLTKTLTFSFRGKTYKVKQGQGDRKAIGRRVCIQVPVFGRRMKVLGESGPLEVQPVEW